MAAPSYTEDLTDIDLAEATTNWDESGDTGWDDGGAPAADSDYPYIQGAVAITQQCTKASIASLLADAGGDTTLPTDGAYFVWHFFASSTGLDTYANGGMRLMVGSSYDDFYSWDVGGVDFGRNPYGGWENQVVNPAIGSPDDTVGTPTATEQFIGAAIKSLVAIGKGNPHGVDAIRYGRGSSIFEFGDLGNGYCTFTGFATENDYNDAVNGYHRWGLIQAIAGGFLYKGKMTLGTGANACDFRDSNVSVLIDNTPKVTANFNTIEVNNAGSRVDWTNVKFNALGTVSPGRLVCNANADLNWDSCQFADMGTFLFGGSSSTCTNAIWNKCGLITAAGATLNGSKILESTVAANASALGWNVATDPDGYLDDMTFVRGANAHHGIELGLTSPLTMTFRGLTVSGFNAADGQNDSFFHVKRTSGDVTINIIGGTGNFKYKSDGANVTIVISPVTTEITVKDPDDVVVENARVLVKAGDATGDLPYKDTVTITSSGTTASVSHTGHGMSSGDKVEIRGANEQDYNGVFAITNVTTDAYDYVMGGDPASPATGTIKATGVVIHALTSALGVASASASYSVDQNVYGVVRKSSASPYFKLITFTDVIDKSAGLPKSVQFVLDE
jgi:hypothetical protein